MPEKLQKETYSLHRYINENGIPDYEKIFSDGDSKFWIKRHLDVWLLSHLDNQPDIVRKDRHLKKHLQECEECRQKSEPDKIEEQMDLPINPE